MKKNSPDTNVTRTKDITQTSVKFRRGQSANIVAFPGTKLERKILDRLCTYLQNVTGNPVKISKSLEDIQGASPVIFLANENLTSPIPSHIPKGSDEAFVLITTKYGSHPLVVAAGRTDKGLKRAVQRLVIASKQEPEALVIPYMNLAEKPWIPFREWTFCPWDPHLVRGVFNHEYANKLLNVYKYNREQLSKYVEMFDWFGFSGAQLAEVCYTYQIMGSIESAQDWQKRMADLIHSNGQQVSLIAWTACFSGFGWQDPEAVSTPKEGNTAFEDPDVRRTFEKYYDLYANLAPFIDRFFGHFYDPGILTDRTDVFKYMRLLETKLKAKNPKIKMGIDCWSATPDFLIELAENGFKDYLMLPVAFPEAFSPGAREEFHKQAEELGMNLGIWGWYMTEYETDQMPSMHVNTLMMKDYYNRMKDGALQIHPVEYWSEMEAYHLCNIFTMYSSSQLLWNPDRDPNDIHEEFCSGIWGPLNGPKVIRAVELIQDMRSGPTWETYWWSRPEYKQGSDHPELDLQRVEESLSEMQSMKTDASYIVKFPLPFPPKTFIDLMIPHLRQIRQFAKFRIEIEKIRKAADEGAPKDSLEAMLRDAWQPVMEFDTWVGTIGLPEVRLQKMIIAGLNASYGLNVKDPDVLRSTESNRLLQQLRRSQGNIKKQYIFAHTGGTFEFFWMEETSRDRFDKLVDDGLITMIGENHYCLTDWENWASNK